MIMVTKFHNFIRHDLDIDACHRNQPNKSKLVLYGSKLVLVLY